MNIITKVARCTTLSRAAKGLAMEIAALPPGSPNAIAALAKLSTDGRDATRSKVIELLEAGFLRRTRTHGPKGFGPVTYELTDPSEVTQ